MCCPKDVGYNEHMLTFLDYTHQYNLIDGVVLHKLQIHADTRGMVFEALHPQWNDVFTSSLPFGQSFISVTFPGQARDETDWHNHLTQVDRFIILSGDAVFALFDWRKNSPTANRLNLFLMGESNKNDQYLLLIPKNVLHSFAVVGKKPCILAGYPTTTYNPKGQQRIAFPDADVALDNKQLFSWNIIREEYQKRARNK